MKQVLLTEIEVLMIFNMINQALNNDIQLAIAARKAGKPGMADLHTKVYATRLTTLEKFKS